MTVRRFGWSDASQAEAQAMADERASEAMRQWLRGEKIARREIKQVYGGGDGLPIREEIVRTEGDTVITRNSYGALCLNTPDVMFVDIDVDESPRFRFSCGLGLAIVAVSIAAAFWQRQYGIFILCGAVLLLGAHGVLKLLNAAHRRAGKNPWDATLERIRRFSRERPDWQLRLYRTPAGFRVLVAHALFDPRGPEAQECFQALGADPVYARMCVNQRCFRARISPKPWRAGMPEPLRPRPGVWPVKEEHLEKRRQWVAAYDAKAAGFAACQFIESLGGLRADPKAEAVGRLHDGGSRARSGLPLA